jgi:hypothetical protein
MSCTLTLFRSHLRSDRRSKSHNRNPSTHNEILSSPARLITLLRSMNMEPRSWVVELTEKLENLRVREESRQRKRHDDQDWSDARPTSRHTLRKVNVDPHHGTTAGVAHLGIFLPWNQLIGKNHLVLLPSEALIEGPPVDMTRMTNSAFHPDSDIRHLGRHFTGGT